TERAHQGRRARHRLSESPRASRPRERLRGHQRVAVSKAAELSARSAGRFALANATDPAAASAARTEKPGPEEPVRSDRPTATSGRRIMPTIRISDDTPVIVPNDALPK